MKIKQMKILGATLAFILVAALLISACKTEATDSTDSTPELPVFTVTITTNGGTPGTIIKQVKQGETLTLSGTDIPSNSAKYITGIKEYRDQDNKLFVMGSTPVNGDMKLRVRWSVDLSIIRDMLNPTTPTETSWINSAQSLRYTFLKTSNVNELVADSYQGGTKGSNDTTILTENDRVDYDFLARFTPYIGSYKYIKALSDTSVTLADINAVPASVPTYKETTEEFTRQ